MISGISKKQQKWLYWAVTAPVLLMLLAGGIGMVTRNPQNIEGLIQLGYPVYLAAILGPAKILGVIAIAYGRFSLLKEWAYAGFTFNLLGASMSHYYADDSVGKILIPLVLLVLLMTSYRMDRKWRKGSKS